jgi:hypothetical protein
MTLLCNLASQAEQQNLHFLLIGGHAVNIHGYSRATEDIDLLINREDMLRWKTLLDQAGYRIVHDGGTFQQFEGNDPQMPGVDLMLVNQQTYEKLSMRAVPASPELKSIKLVCVEHLIALKLHVLKQDLAHRRIRDFLDVVELIKANKIDLQNDEMREIFSRYGTEDLYRRIKLAVE